MMHGSLDDHRVNPIWPEAIYWHHRFQDTHQKDLTDEEILHWLAWIETAENRLIYEKYCDLLGADRGVRKKAHPAIPVMVSSAALIGVTFLVSSNQAAVNPVLSLLQRAPEGLFTLIPSSSIPQPLSRPDPTAHARLAPPPGTLHRPPATPTRVPPSPRETSQPSDSRSRR